MLLPDGNSCQIVVHPPLTVAVKVVVPPSQNVVAPAAILMEGEGPITTVTVFVPVQPFESVIVTVYTCVPMPG